MDTWFDLAEGLIIKVKFLEGTNFEIFNNNVTFQDQIMNDFLALGRRNINTN